MKKVSDFLTEAKRITGSDYATAKRIGMTRAGVSKARKNDIISIEYAVKLAALIDVNPSEIVAAADVQAHPENGALWGKWITAASVTMALGIATQTVDIQAESASYDMTSVYIMRT